MLVVIRPDSPSPYSPMPNTASEPQIKERIETFVQELDVLVRKSALEALRGVLEGSQPAPRRGRPSGRRPTRAPAASADGLAPRIVGHVQANPGQTVGQIVQAVGGSAGAAKKVIKSLLAEKQIRKTGQRRGTRYFPPGAGRLPGAVAKKARRKRGRRRKA